ncbi:DUF6480 family protein [Cellulomonas chengniuliangii]|uniref:DUF6480 family protein n=1 Tax=Cellulomonas chengniuliangii TaxID=2968084 RepID=A0ABY5L0A9_9CELL|nr:DUF6480 family protein [Cellulomonas chengniuliangii]MCC2310124.1 DUF6480 family protein [Cellulomonas chengniuliangii]MCC2316363.1 DUF6480 family protein [Cellulomonas chengniuliangii]UUI76212.1 DUF6480 family protein [Cellulomonas chengniuliangii]
MAERQPPSDPPTDPPPEDTSGLGHGGSVHPGDTPPAEASATGGVSFREPKGLVSGRSTPRNRAMIVAGVVLVVVLAALAAAWGAGWL